MKLPITNKKKFVYSTITKIHIPLNFEVFYCDNVYTHHYINKSKGCEGIILEWDSDVFDMKNNIYIRELK